ncbi:unnamed protein product [Ambrosiozyma monospora]|uniref:Unnamed protein product n=1 Tax=Ambrosiozyma monospora TaxID=43982 RepID=A0ACB5TUW9_AMBMO|nr:unnamed protein product [Ambrosiozyma monospora]
MNSQLPVQMRSKVTNSSCDMIQQVRYLTCGSTGSITSAVDTGFSLSGLSLKSLVNVTRRKEKVPVFTGEGPVSVLEFTMKIHLFIYGLAPDGLPCFKKGTIPMYLAGEALDWFMAANVVHKDDISFEKVLEMMNERFSYTNAAILTTTVSGVKESKIEKPKQMVNVSVDKDGSAKETLKTAIKKRKTKLTSHDDKASVGNEVNVVGAVTRKKC